MALRKYVYWLPSDRYDRLPLQPKKIARVVPCVAIRSEWPSVLVLPEAWSRTCKRQGSWYRASRLAGHLMLVTNAPLEDATPCAPEVFLVEASDFEPPRLPDAAEMRRMAEDPAYLARCPAEWSTPSLIEIRGFVRWVDRLLPDDASERHLLPPERWDELFLHHNANHANFFFPRYYVTEKGAPAPYSIAPSRATCSSCIELFGVIGERHPVRYVNPCPGSCMYASLPEDGYLKVTRIRP